MRKLQSLSVGITFVFLLLMSACIPKIEVLDESDKWNPDFGIPLAVATISMEDLLENVEADSVIQINQDSLLVVRYRERVSVTAPPDIPPIPDFAVPILDYSQSIPNPTSGDFRLDVLEAKEGTIRYGINNPYLEAVEVSLRLIDIRLEGSILEWNFTLPPAISSNQPSYQEGQMDLSDYEIDLRDGFDTEYLATLSGSGTSVPLHPFALEVFDLDYKYMQGYFGQFEIVIPGDSLYFGFLDSWEAGILQFVDPKLRIFFHTNYGVPAEMKANTLLFRTFNSGEQPLNNPMLDNGLMMNTPNINEVGEFRTTTVEMNKNNSNISGAISGIPYQLDYDLQVLANPNEDTSIVNHLLDSVRADADIEVELPLYGSARGFTFEDKFDFDVSGLEDVERMGLKLIADNEFPVEVKIQLNFLDDNDELVLTLYDEGLRPLVEAAEVDANGDVSNPTRTATFSELSADQFGEIKARATQIQIVSSIETPNDGSTPVRFYSYYHLILSIGLEVGL